MGSSDIDNWVREAKESTNAFWKSHVEQPVSDVSPFSLHVLVFLNSHWGAAIFYLLNF